MQLYIDLLKGRPIGSRNRNVKYISRRRDPQTGKWIYDRFEELDALKRPAGQLLVVEPDPALEQARTSDEIEQIVREQPLGNVDPLELAARLLDIQTGKRVRAGDKKSGRISPFPPDAVAKFGSDDALQQELHTRPATTLLTLGMVHSTHDTRRVNDQIALEWEDVIRNLSWRDAKALSATATYQAKAGEGQVSRARFIEESRDAAQKRLRMRRKVNATRDTAIAEHKRWLAKRNAKGSETTAEQSAQKLATLMESESPGTKASKAFRLTTQTALQQHERWLRDQRRAGKSVTPEASAQQFASLRYDAEEKYLIPTLAPKPEKYVSPTRAFMSERAAEFQQVGHLALINRMRQYRAKPQDPNDRFDRIAFSTIKHAIHRAAMDDAKKNGMIEEYLPERDKNDPMQHIWTNKPLAPDDSLDLKRLELKAKPLIAQLFGKQRLHPSLARVFQARWWLEDDAEHEYVSTAADAAHSAEQHDAPAFRYNRERPWTEIIAKYPVWDDPDRPGEKVDLREMSSAAATLKLSKWYTQARTKIASHLYTDADQETPDGNVMHVEMDGSEQTAVDHMVRLATGITPSKAIAPTKAGRMILRYLSLQHMLGSGRRSVATSAELPATKQVITRKLLPRVGAVYTNHDDTPAVQFFGHPDHQELARRLGIDTAKLKGVVTRRGVSATAPSQRVLNVANSLHQRYEWLRTLPASQRAGVRLGANNKLRLLSALDKPLDAYHKAATAYHAELGKLRATKVTRRELARQEVDQRASQASLVTAQRNLARAQAALKAHPTATKDAARAARLVASAQQARAQVIQQKAALARISAHQERKADVPTKAEADARYQAQKARAEAAAQVYKVAASRIQTALPGVVDQYEELIGSRHGVPPELRTEAALTLARERKSVSTTLDLIEHLHRAVAKSAPEGNLLKALMEPWRC